jgi:nucleolar GTP-binding protein
MASQVKKKLKNRPVLPRTATLTTLSEMAEKLTKAGYDPSRIVERATLIAKSRGAQTQLAKKRKRDEEMDVDEDGAEVDGDADWMDVDEEGAIGKRRKGNSGTAVAVATAKLHAPKTNRTSAGMRDETVGGSPINTL